MPEAKFFLWVLQLETKIYRKFWLSWAKLKQFSTETIKNVVLDLWEFLIVIWPWNYTMVELTPKHRIDNERIDKLTKRVRRTEILFLFMAMFFVTKIFTDHHNHASINASSLHELENAISSLRDNQHDMAIKIEQDVSHYVKRKLGEMKRDSISKDMIHDSHAQKRKILRMENYKPYLIKVHKNHTINII